MRRSSRRGAALRPVRSAARGRRDRGRARGRRRRASSRRRRASPRRCSRSASAIASSASRPTAGFRRRSPTLPKVGTFLKPDAELIAGLRPDLVIVHEVGNGLDRRLGVAADPVRRSSTAARWRACSRRCARSRAAAGVPERADALVGDVAAAPRRDPARRCGAAEATRALHHRPAARARSPISSPSDRARTSTI